MRLRNLIATAFLLGGIAISAGGCVTAGEGVKNVTCETVKFVWLSRKDTPGTIRQVTRNNGSWVALCGDPGKAPPGLDKEPTLNVVKDKKTGLTKFLKRWRPWNP